MSDAGEASVRTESSETFRQAVELTEVDASVYDRAFTATPQYVPWPKAYGGDMLAQAAAAAMATVESDRSLHSLHSSFLRPVDMHIDVRYEVELLRDGRGYTTRHVRGFQHGKAVILTTASFQVPEEGPRFEPELPDVPDPESLPSSAEALAGVETADARYWSHGRSFDQRHVPGPLYLSIEGRAVPHQAVWVKAFDRLDGEPDLHRVAIIYVCDYTILEPSLRVLGLHWSSPGLTTASLDNSMWFHQHARADGWLLYAQEAAAVGSGRGLNLGRFFTASGSLVATVAQEGLIRCPAPARE
jgi:acyl-CoA thioesterase II